jgi:hypothetical protein
MQDSEEHLPAPTRLSDDEKKSKFGLGDIQGASISTAANADVSAEAWINRLQNQ